MLKHTAFFVRVGIASYLISSCNPLDNYETTKTVKMIKNEDYETLASGEQAKCVKIRDYETEAVARKFKEINKGKRLTLGTEIILPVYCQSNQ
ncbi:MAG: hypothetical protein AABX84_01860 [Nanoarchaeota archaeon]